jgi:hypothetical protein
LPRILYQLIAAICVRRNLAISLRSLALVSRLMPALRERLEHLPTLTDKQAVTLARNFDSAAKDYSDHLGECLSFPVLPGSMPMTNGSGSCYFFH